MSSCYNESGFTPRARVPHPTGPGHPDGTYEYTPRRQSRTHGTDSREGEHPGGAVGALGLVGRPDRPAPLATCQLLQRVRSYATCTCARYIRLSDVTRDERSEPMLSRPAAVSAPLKRGAAARGMHTVDSAAPPAGGRSVQGRTWGRVWLSAELSLLV